MKAQHTYESNGIRWLLALEDQQVQVFCDGMMRSYDIAETVTEFKADNDYVYIYVRHPEVKFYQFKFEADRFLVADVFDTEDQHIGEFACHVFGDEV